MRHEIPTHLHVEDTVLFGMTMRQVMLVALGATFGYGFWLRLTWLAMILRWPCAVAPALVALTFAFIKPDGRVLEEWLWALLHYVASPKICVWRRRGMGGQNEKI